MSSRFFQNTACPYFPCHTGVSRDDFNCLFCYCPLYALGEECGGNYRYSETGKKVCTDCNHVHVRENYDDVLQRVKILVAKVTKE